MSYTHYHKGPNFRDFIVHMVKSKNSRSYLEVGVRDGSTLCLIPCPSIGVDPFFNFNHNPILNKTKLHLFQMTSDQFFREHDPREILKTPLDVVFLDGLHQFEFLLRDFINAEAVSHRDTLIMLDDCLPVNTEMTERVHHPDARTDHDLAAWWTGDVWKVVYILMEFRPDLHITCVDTRPTGNVCVTNLDSSSTILRDNYYNIVKKYVEIAMSDQYLESFYNRIATKSGFEIMRDFDASLVGGP